MTTTNTIERIRWERKRVQKELKHLEQVIADDYNELTAPPPPSNNKLETMVSVASRAWNIFDGAMMGYKPFQIIYTKARHTRSCLCVSCYQHHKNKIFHF